MLQAAVKIWVEVNDWHAIVNTLDVLIALAVAPKQSVRALPLAGAAVGLRVAEQAVLPPVLQAHFDQMVAAARLCWMKQPLVQLGPQDKRCAWRKWSPMWQRWKVND